jgi:3-ketosteroid 9alpha-monooxygenase subunit A
MSYRFPFPPYPRGWYVIGYSDDLPSPSEKPVSLHYFGRDLVAFRTTNGTPVVVDAHCPHLGAHLGDGVVCEGTLQCPFHGWRFDGGGRCVHIPLASKIPPRAVAQTWPVREVGSLISVFFNPEGDAEGGAPEWEPPPLPELVSPEWLPVERRRWRVRTHVQETNENNCDAAHLTFLHTLLEVQSTAQADGHVLNIRHAFKADLARLGMPGTVFEGVVEGTHTGVGILQQRFRVMVEGLLVSMQTPIDEEHVDLRFAFTVKIAPDEATAKMAAHAMLEDVVRDVEQDIRIWERKVYHPKPVLSDADGPIGQYRKWVRQF